jgi:hypothetical protein
VAGLPSHPDADHPGADAEPALDGGLRRRRVLGVIGALALAVLVVVLHLTGVVGSGSH